MKTNLKFALAGLAVFAWNSAASAQNDMQPAPLQQDDPHADATLPGQTLGGLRDVINFNMGARNVKALLIEDRKVWLGTSSGLVRYDTFTGDHRTYDNRTGLLSSGIFHLSRVDGELWVGTYGGGLSILDPETDQFRHYNIQHGLGDAFIYDAVTMDNGDVWFATWSGANLVVDGDLDDVSKWRLFTVANTGGGLPNDWVYGLAKGANGEVWFATEGGLAHYKNGRWSHWTHAEGLGADYDVVKDAIDFQNDPGQISSHHARQKVDQGIADISVAYNPNYVVALTVGKNGAVWVGTWGAGLSRFDGREWSTLTTKDGLPGNHVFSLETLEDGRLLVGTNRGVAVFDGENFRSFDVSGGVQSNTIFSMAAKGDAVWIGGYGGASWLPNGFENLLSDKEGAQ
ncbi:MAG: two-component regulator propeller domain-containing protein [Parvularculaceae bacterium]